MTTGGHTGYTRASLKNFDVWLRAHKSQPLSKGLIFLTFFFDCSEPRGLTCLLPLQAKPLCRPSQPRDRSPLAAPVPFYIITWSPPWISAKVYIFPGSYHPSNLQVWWLTWNLPPLEFKTAFFANETIRLHVRQGVRSTWQVSGTTSPMQPENAASPQPGVSGPSTPFSTLLYALPRALELPSAT